MQWRRPLSRRSAGAFGLTLATAALIASPGSLHGNETDQFLLPTDQPLVEVGSVISTAHYLVLEEYVNRTNDRIERARRVRNRTRRREALEQAHSPLAAANQVRAAFGPGFFETIELETAFRSSRVRSLYSGRPAAYKTSNWIYSSVHLPVDPRKIPLSLPSSTLRVFGHYVGTDKFGHFHDLGHLYHQEYRNLCRVGVDPAEAQRRAVEFYTRGPISEAGVIGFFATGVFSNGDLAANYLGFKFYLNLTEPVMLEGVEHPPMLIRIGDYWALNRHVRPESDFFRPFVSDHWNEALNPCVYEWGAAGPVAKKLRDHTDEILTVYADEHGNKRPREWFVDKASSLVTYFGENYGHSGLDKATVTIASCCFNPPREKPPPMSSGPEELKGRCGAGASLKNSRAAGACSGA